MIRNYILIIGAMKSGTTTLFDLLANHPAIAPCSPKEPGFFAFEDRWAEGFEWYESLFDFDGHTYALDGSTDYSKYPFCTGVADRLAKSVPRRFKLIYIMRHPLRRIESHARHVQRTRHEIGLLPSVRADHGLEFGISPVSLAASRYASQIERYQAYYRSGDLLLISFEELVADQSRVLSSVLDFLSLQPTEIGPIHSNQAREIRQTPALWSTLNSLGPVSYFAKAVVPQHMRHRLRDALGRKVKLTGRFTLTTEEEADLIAELKPDLDCLQETYGIEIKRLWDIE